MADSSVTVDVGVTTDNLKAGAGQVQSIISQMLSSLSSSFSNIFSQSNKSVENFTEGSSEAFKTMKENIFEYAAEIATVAFFKEAISSTVEMDREAVVLSRDLGITTQAASGLSIALEENFSSSQQFSNAAAMMDRQLKTNEKSFNELGIATRDASGNFRNQLDIMLDANHVISEYAEGTDRNIIGQRLYGRAFKDLGDVISITKDQMQEAQAKSDELGLTVGPDRVAQVNEYHRAMSELGDIFKAIQVQVGSALMPVLQGFADWAKNDGATAVTGIRVAVDILVAGLIGLKEVVQTVMIVASTYAKMFGTALAIVSDVAEKLFKEHSFTAARAAWNSGMQDLTNILKDGGDEMLRVAQKNSESLVSVYNDAAQKLGITQIDTGKKQEEHEQKPKPGKKAGQEVTTKQIDDAISAKLKEKEESIKIDQDYENSKNENFKSSLELQKSLGEKNDADIYASMKQYEDRKTEIQKQAIDERQKAEVEAANAKKALYKNNADMVAAINKQQQATTQANIAAIEKLEEQHQANLQALQNKTIQATQQRYMQMTSAVQGTLTSSVQQMVQGTMTMQKAMANIWQSLENEIISYIIKTTVQHAAAEAAKTAATETGAATRSATETAAAGESLLLTAATAIKQIAIHAWTAAAAVFQSVAAIPFVGWILAPALAIGAVAAVMGFAKNIASASGGWEVPSDQLAMVHKNEMILPASISDHIRNSMSSASGGGKRDLGGGNTNITIQSWDSNDIKQFMKSSGKHIAASLRTQARNFAAVK